MSLKFVWQPGTGIDPDALDRLRAHFQRPAAVMGEAWFMGERRMFAELAGDLDSLDAQSLQAPLVEISSGTTSFGAMAEWDDWYHYLLGQLLPRSHEHFVSSLLELLITGFMAIHPTGVQKSAYRGFESDALNTLGRCMMETICWNDGEIVMGSFLHRSNRNPNQVWCWWDASGDFSASMFFCLKYLPQESLRGWIASVFAIRSPHWRAQVMVWLVGANAILDGQIAWPEDFDINARPCIGWGWSHALKRTLVPSLLPRGSGPTMLAEAKQFFSARTFEDWTSSVNSVPYLKDELAEIPDTFRKLYVTPYA